MKKIIAITCVFLICFSFCGCLNGEFETIMPPVKDFPTPVPCREVEVFKGTFVMEKSFWGNKLNTNTLYLNSNAKATTGFALGETGFVTYNVGGIEITLNATISSCPKDGLGEFYVHHDLTSTRVPMGYPGRFWVVLLEEKNTLMIDKTAVIVLDDLGNAIVHKMGENGVLQEVKIKIGLSNAEYYQVLSGIAAGEKVVVR